MQREFRRGRVDRTLVRMIDEVGLVDLDVGDRTAIGDDDQREHALHEPFHRSAHLPRFGHRHAGRGRLREHLNPLQQHEGCGLFCAVDAPRIVRQNKLQLVEH